MAISLVATKGSTLGLPYVGQAAILVSSSAQTVFIAGVKAAIVTGVLGETHYHGDNIYDAQPSGGSSKVFVEGFPLHRLGDARACSHTTGIVANTTVYSG